MKNLLKNTKALIALTTTILTLIAFGAAAEDSPSAEELAKMNAAVAKIKSVLADAGMAKPLHILADQLKTSSDPEAIKAGAKIEKMADDLSSSGSGSGGSSSSFGPHGGSTTTFPEMEAIKTGPTTLPTEFETSTKTGMKMDAPEAITSVIISSGKSITPAPTKAVKAPKPPYSPADFFKP
jgi:hypothetical protein